MIADQIGKSLHDKRSFALLKRYVGISKGETEKMYAVLSGERPVNYSALRVYPWK